MGRYLNLLLKLLFIVSAIGTKTQIVKKVVNDRDLTPKILISPDSAIVNPAGQRDPEWMKLWFSNGGVNDGTTNVGLVEWVRLQWGLAISAGKDASESEGKTAMESDVSASEPKTKVGLVKGWKEKKKLPKPAAATLPENSDPVAAGPAAEAAPIVMEPPSDLKTVTVLRDLRAVAAGTATVPQETVKFVALSTSDWQDFWNSTETSVVINAKTAARRVAYRFFDGKPATAVSVQIPGIVPSVGKKLTVTKLAGDELAKWNTERSAKLEQKLSVKSDREDEDEDDDDDVEDGEEEAYKNIDPSKKYDVSKILNERWVGSKSRPVHQYLVQFNHRATPSWQPAENVKHLYLLIREFEKNKKPNANAKPKAKSKPKAKPKPKAVKSKAKTPPAKAGKAKRARAK